MKNKKLAIASGILFLACLVISLLSPHNSAADKWSSFVLGITSAVFIGSLLMFFKDEKTDRNKIA